MLEWHLIGNWGENDLLFINASVKNRSFANAYEHHEKNATLCVIFKALKNKILRCPEMVWVYEKANIGSKATACCEIAPFS